MTKRTNTRVHIGRGAIAARLEPYTCVIVVVAGLQRCSGGPAHVFVKQRVLRELWGVCLA